jgi:hypothetical protein
MGDIMNLESNIKRIVSKVIALPLDRWRKSQSDIYPASELEVYEGEYNRSTLSVMRKHSSQETSLWYDGTMITESNSEISELYNSLESYNSQRLEDKRIKRIEEIAQLF